MSPNRIWTQLLLAVFLAIPATRSALAQEIYSAGYPGVYFNSTLTGWGWTMDIQRGVMFVAVFGYDQSGGEAFVTLISNRVDPADPFTYSGNVFLTNDNGQATEDVGDFVWRMMRTDSQPSARLDMTSPIIEVEDFLLTRFGYLDSDLLSPLAGRSWALGFTDQIVAPDLERLGDFLTIGSERFQTQGITALDVVSSNPDVSGLVFLDDASGLFSIALQDATRPNNEFLLLTCVANHQIMSFGAAGFSVGQSLTQQRAFVASSSAENITVTKRRPSLDPALAQALIQQGQWFAGQSERLRPMRDPGRESTLIWKN